MKNPDRQPGKPNKPVPYEQGRSMKEVRIVLVHDLSSGYDDDDSQSAIKEGVTDWEQVSDEEYRLLKDHWWRLSHEMGAYARGRPVLLEKDSEPVKQRIGSIREWVRKEQERVQAESAAKRAKVEERARKKLLKDAESELKLLEELRKKYPDA